MILTRDDILKEIANGTIKVEPLDPGALGPASLDMRLGREIRIFSPVPEVVAITHAADYRHYSYKLDMSESGYVLKPGELVLGITVEKVTLPPGIAGWLSARSRYARLGLMVHMTAPFMQPGISNHQVLEMYNAGPNYLKLVPNERVCQFIFERCTGEAAYHGAFMAQEAGNW